MITLGYWVIVRLLTLHKYSDELVIVAMNVQVRLSVGIRDGSSPFRSLAVGTQVLFGFQEEQKSHMHRKV